jgi:hypothetical protein
MFSKNLIAVRNNGGAESRVWLMNTASSAESFHLRLRCKVQALAAFAEGEKGRSVTSVRFQPCVTVAYVTRDEW